MNSMAKYHVWRPKKHDCLGLIFAISYVITPTDSSPESQAQPDAHRHLPSKLVVFNSFSSPTPPQTTALKNACATTDAPVGLVWV